MPASTAGVKAENNAFQSLRSLPVQARGNLRSRQMCHPSCAGPPGRQSGPVRPEINASWIGHRTWNHLLARHGQYPYLAPCQWHLWQSGSQHHHSDTALPGHCGFAVKAPPSPPPPHRAGGALAQLGDKLPLQKKRQWQTASAGELFFSGQHKTGEKTGHGL